APRHQHLTTNTAPPTPHHQHRTTLSLSTTSPQTIPQTTSLRPPFYARSFNNCFQVFNCSSSSFDYRPFDPRPSSLTPALFDLYLFRPLPFSTSAFLTTRTLFTSTTSGYSLIIQTCLNS